MQVVDNLTTVSENKPVGSSSGGDLLGSDEVSTPVTNGQSGGSRGNQDLLADIFGSSDPSAPTSGPTSGTASPPPKSQQSTIDDILGLFGNTPSATPAAAAAPPPGFMSTSSPPPPTMASNPLSAFSLPQTQSAAPTAPTPPVAPAPRLTSYTAYEKNSLKITLTPQTSANKPGVVMILARFQVSGGTSATGLTFQAAVPKVCLSPS